MTQELVLAYGKAFVTNESKAYVVIDTATDAITDSVPVSRGGNSIVEDANGKLWVACTGGSGTPPALYRIDPQTAQVEASFTFSNSATNPWRLRINGSNDTLYFLRGGVYRMAITDAAAPVSAFIPTDGRNLYGLGIDPNTGTLYLADAVDYVQRGVIYRYRPDGTLLGTFHAGIIPGAFAFGEVTGEWSLVNSEWMRTAGSGVRRTQLRATNHEPPITSHQPPITNLSLVPSFRPSIALHSLLRITSMDSLMRQH